MSFTGYKEKIEAGDTVILHIGFGNMLNFVVKPGETHQTKYGAIRHSDLLGIQYGSKIQCPSGWLYVLHPTPELWTLNLPHRTQILYTPDISVIVLQLDLKPGSVVVESGTGSASLSHALIRTVQPSGHLHTFEFHEERAKKAGVEFDQHGVSKWVTVKHRDVCEEGFDLTNVADAVFLDLPRPWLALDSAKQALKKEGGRVCSFSPCIEQVQRTSLALQKLGFHDITTLESLQRCHDVKAINIPLPTLGFDKRLTTIDKIESSNDGNNSGNCEKENAKKIKIEESVDAKKDNCNESVKIEPMLEDNDCHVDNDLNKSTKKTNNSKSGKVKNNRDYYLDLIGKRDEGSFSFRSSVPNPVMAGHTGFLTFATLYPDES